jgi:hypothetical protein
VSSSSAAYGREQGRERAKYADKGPLQGDYLDPFIEEAAEKMLDGAYVKPHADIEPGHIKQFWARSFKLRDKLAADRGVTVPERKAKAGSSTPTAPGNDALVRLEAKVAVLEARLAALEQRAGDGEIPF